MTFRVILETNRNSMLIPMYTNCWLIFYNFDIGPFPAYFPSEIVPQNKCMYSYYSPLSLRQSGDKCFLVLCFCLFFYSWPLSSFPSHRWYFPPNSIYMETNWNMVQICPSTHQQQHRIAHLLLLNSSW